MATNLSPIAVAANSEPPPKRTRRRVPISCNLCHSRKLKCNRQKPCSSCEIRGEGSKCVYASRTQDEDQSVPKRRRMTHKDDELQQRLENLERMILDAANGRNGHLDYPTSDAASGYKMVTYATKSSINPELQNPAVGSLDTGGPNAVYAGDTAFHGILQEVCWNAMCI